MTELSDIIGQDGAISRLLSGYRGGRRPHAYLFTGPMGVGRRTTAIAWARMLLCSRPVTVADITQACGQCESCRIQQAGSHPDFHLIYKELAKFHDDANVRNRVMQDLGIDVIRSFLLNQCDRAASMGRGKVFVVLEADLMSIAAQNALLKTLEEPPKGVTIILICRQAEQMLPTTLSRCSIVRFSLLPGEFVADQLKADSIDPREADFWSAYTGGSIGQSLLLARQGFYEIKSDIIDRLAAAGSAGDTSLGEHLTKITDKLATAAVAEAKKADGSNLSKMLASRRAAGEMLKLIASAFSDAMKLATAADTSLVHTDQSDAIRALAQRLEPTKLALAIEQLSRYEQLLWRNVNPKIVWDNTVITCTSAAPLTL